MNQVTVKSEYTSSSLGDFPSQAAALIAIARFILMAYPPHVSIILERDGNVLSVYRVQTKGKRGFRHVTFIKEMEFTIS